MPKYFDKSTKTLFNCRTAVEDKSTLSERPDQVITLDEPPALADQAPPHPTMARTASIATADQSRVHGSGYPNYIDLKRRLEVSGVYDETDSIVRVDSVLKL